LRELTNVSAERERLGRELREVDRAGDAARAKLANEVFLARAPSAVIERERTRAQELTERAKVLKDRLAALESAT
jgi:valyl-tRNA synthetase